MKYLITGSAGYIGSQLIKRLETTDSEIFGLYHTNKPDFSNNVEFIQGDISDKSIYSKLPKDIDIIIHCAALVKDYGSKKEFIKVNVEGTRNLLGVANKNNSSHFISLGHINYEAQHRFNHYSEMKKISEQYLMDKKNQSQVPITIIRPGNVFGPAAPVWVVRILESMKRNNFRFIEHGNGTFHHTYIENILDAIGLTIGNKRAFNQIIDVTDGDHSVSFKDYFISLSNMIGLSKPFKNMSKRNALRLGTTMILLHKITRIKPVISPLAVEILTNNKFVSIKKAQKLLSYQPRISYHNALQEINKWVKNEYNYGKTFR